jgi:hypothetical protein
MLPRAALERKERVGGRKDCGEEMDHMIVRGKERRLRD